MGRRHDRTYSIPTSGVWTGPTLTAASPDNGGAASSLTASLRSGEYQIGVNALDIEGYPAKIELYRDATFALGYTRRVDVAGRLVSRFDRSQLPIASAATDTFLDTPRFENQRVIYDPRTSRTRPQFVESDLPAGSYGSYDGITGGYDTELDATAIDGFGGGAARPAQYDYTRDAGGRVLIERHRMCTSCTLPGVEDVPTSRTSLYATSYTYRADGRIGSVNNADGAHTYTYDARGQVSTLTAAEGTYAFTYDEMGRNIGLNYPDGHTRSQRYDELGRLRERCYEYPSAPPRCYSAIYDPVGNIVSLTDPEGTDTITVDALDRITRVTRAGAPDEDYTYNALGALTHNGTTALSTDRPRLDGAGTASSAVPASLNGQPITLDLGGRVTTLGTAALRWTNTSVLRDVTESGATTNFAIDAFHRRIWKSAGGVTELYLYDGANRIATAATKVNPPPAEPSVYRRDRWLYEGIDHPLRVVHETDDHLSIRTAYFELDLAGNVRRLRAEGGADLGGYRYSAFGKTLENTVVDAAFSDQPLRWKGRWHYTFGGVEVYDMRARQWCPELGVFLSVDDYAFHDATSTLWGWPRQNPIRSSDPWGRGENNPIVLLLFTALGMGVAAPSDTSAAPANVLGMAASVPGLGPAVGGLIRGLLEEAASRVPGLGKLLQPGKGLIRAESGAGAGSCVETAEANLAKYPGSTTVYSPVGKHPHVAVRLPDGSILDPTLRGNLQVHGAYVGDITPGTTTFTEAEWNSLIQRLPNLPGEPGTLPDHPW